ncbi:MAG: hypothetical protein K6A94_00235 [Bacteroidales bacterium]|nr:hypothetical protein [Bacteroidales bacterium]
MMMHLNIRRNCFKRLCVALLLFASFSTAIAQGTSFRDGLFRYSPMGRSLLSDMHPDFIRADVASITNHSEWDWGQTGESMRLNTFGWLGFGLPVWSGNISNEKNALSVTLSTAASCWLDLFEPVTAPVVNADWRIALPTVSYLHRTGLEGLKNFQVSVSLFKHESTHVGDEIVLQHVNHGFPIHRVNVSYNYSEYAITLNDPEEIYEPYHTLRLGVMLLWNFKKGWYFIDSTDGDASLAHPKNSPWEAYLQYQYQTRASKHGFQGVAALEVRNRVLYGYPVFDWACDEFGITSLNYETQEETRIFTYNLFLGVRFCNPKYDGLFSRVSLGLRAYHGNNPHGQFRNHKNFNQIGACLVIQ